MFGWNRYAPAWIACAIFAVPLSAQHTITLTLQGMAAHQGRMFKARMVDVATAQQVAETTVTAIPGASFAVAFAGESGKSYIVDFFVDVDGNGAYSPPPADHAWRRPAGPLHHEGLTLAFTHDLVFTDINYPAAPASVAPGLAKRDPGKGPPDIYRGRSLLGRQVPPQKVGCNSSPRL